MSHRIPTSLVTEQWPAISGMVGGLLWSFAPDAIKSRLIDPVKERTATVKPASDNLVDHYIRWCGAEEERYRDHLPPHFFAKYGMNMVASLVGQVPYNMLSVVNQGCRFQINSLIPRNTNIELRGRLVECTEQGSRVRVHTQVIVGTADQPNAMVVDTVAAVMLGKQPKKPSKAKPEHDFVTIGNWSADRHEGQRFFLLTGDFNPIHTFWPMAKRSRFGGCILHGFASYGRSYEAMLNAGYTISDIDLKFVKPNLLPNNNLAVQVAKTDQPGSHVMRLISESGDVYLAGSFLGDR